MDDRKDTICHAGFGESGTVAEPREDQQCSSAKREKLPLVTELMERVCNSANLNRAYK